MDLVLEGQRAAFRPPCSTFRPVPPQRSGRRRCYPDLSVAVTVDGPVIGNADKTRTLGIIDQRSVHGRVPLETKGTETLRAANERTGLQAWTVLRRAAAQPARPSRHPPTKEEGPRREFLERRSHSPHAPSPRVRVRKKSSGPRAAPAWPLRSGHLRSVWRRIAAATSSTQNSSVGLTGHQ